MLSEKMFSVTLGTFPHDVSLRNVTIGGEPLALVETVEVGLQDLLCPIQQWHPCLPVKSPILTPSHLSEGETSFFKTLTQLNI